MDNNGAYVFGMAVNALVTAIGMVSDNQQALARGESIPYPEKAFLAVLDSTGIHHNALVERLYR
jgi:hypothetical protein